MKCLDLFCGAGGAGEGYRRAGFDVTGVDIRPMPHNPHTFCQADALEFCREHGHEYDFVHASPPCQAHTALKTMHNAKKHLDLIPATREALKATGKPYVIENVPGAATLAPVLLLCGTMFDLGTGDAELRRHRYFELSFPMNMMIPQCRHYERGRVCGVYGGHGRDRRRLRPATVGVYGNGNGRDYRKRPAVVGVYGNTGGKSVRDGTQQFSVKERAEAMGIDWMTGNELSQAIPPAYTELIGRMVMQFLRSNTCREP